MGTWYTTGTYYAYDSYTCKQDNYNTRINNIFLKEGDVVELLSPVNFTKYTDNSATTIVDIYFSYSSVPNFYTDTYHNFINYPPSLDSNFHTKVEYINIGAILINWVGLGGDCSYNLNYIKTKYKSSNEKGIYKIQIEKNGWYGFPTNFLIWYGMMKKNVVGWHGWSRFPGSPNPTLNNLYDLSTNIMYLSITRGSYNQNNINNINTITLNVNNNFSNNNILISKIVDDNSLNYTNDFLIENKNNITPVDYINTKTWNPSPPLNILPDNIDTLNSSELVKNYKTDFIINNIKLFSDNLFICDIVKENLNITPTISLNIDAPSIILNGNLQTINREIKIIIGKNNPKQYINYRNINCLLGRKNLSHYINDIVFNNDSNIKTKIIKILSINENLFLQPYIQLDYSNIILLNNLFDIYRSFDITKWNEIECLCKYPMSPIIKKVGINYNTINNTYQEDVYTTDEIKGNKIYTITSGKKIKITLEEKYRLDYNENIFLDVDKNFNGITLIYLDENGNEKIEDIQIIPKVNHNNLIKEIEFDIPQINKEYSLRIRSKSKDGFLSDDQNLLKIVNPNTKYEGYTEIKFILIDKKISLSPKLNGFTDGDIDDNVSSLPRISTYTVTSTSVSPQYNQLCNKEGYTETPIFDPFTNMNSYNINTTYPFKTKIVAKHPNKLSYSGGDYYLGNNLITEIPIKLGYNITPIENNDNRINIVNSSVMDLVTSLQEKPYGSNSLVTYNNYKWSSSDDRIDSEYLDEYKEALNITLENLPEVTIISRFLGNIQSDCEISIYPIYLSGTQNITSLNECPYIFYDNNVKKIHCKNSNNQNLSYPFYSPYQDYLTGRGIETSEYCKTVNGKGTIYLLRPYSSKNFRYQDSDIISGYKVVIKKDNMIGEKIVTIQNDITTIDINLKGVLEIELFVKPFSITSPDKPLGYVYFEYTSPGKTPRTSDFIYMKQGWSSHQSEVLEYDDQTGYLKIHTSFPWNNDEVMDIINIKARFTSNQKNSSEKTNYWYFNTSESSGIEPQIYNINEDDPRGYFSNPLLVHRLPNKIKLDLKYLKLPDSEESNIPSDKSIPIGIMSSSGDINQINVSGGSPLLSNVSSKIEIDNKYYLNIRGEKVSVFSLDSSNIITTNLSDNKISIDNQEYYNSSLIISKENMNNYKNVLNDIIINDPIVIKPGYRCSLTLRGYTTESNNQTEILTDIEGIEKPIRLKVKYLNRYKIVDINDSTNVSFTISDLIKDNPEKDVIELPVELYIVSPEGIFTPITEPPISVKFSIKEDELLYPQRITFRRLPSPRIIKGKVETYDQLGNGPSSLDTCKVKLIGTNIETTTKEDGTYKLTIDPLTTMTYSSNIFKFEFSKSVTGNQNPYEIQIKEIDGLKEIGNNEINDFDVILKEKQIEQELKVPVVRLYLTDPFDRLTTLTKTLTPTSNSIDVLVRPEHFKEFGGIEINYEVSSNIVQNGFGINKTRVIENEESDFILSPQKGQIRRSNNVRITKLIQGTINTRTIYLEDNMKDNFWLANTFNNVTKFTINFKVVDPSYIEGYVLDHQGNGINAADIYFNKDNYFKNESILKQLPSKYTVDSAYIIKELDNSILLTETSEAPEPDRVTIKNGYFKIPVYQKSPNGRKGWYNWGTYIGGNNQILTFDPNGEDLPSFITTRTRTFKTKDRYIRGPKDAVLDISYTHSNKWVDVDDIDEIKIKTITNQSKDELNGIMLTLYKEVEGINWDITAYAGDKDGRLLKSNSLPITIKDIQPIDSEGKIKNIESVFNVQGSSELISQLFEGNEWNESYNNFYANLTTGFLTHSEKIGLAGSSIVWNKKDQIVSIILTRFKGSTSPIKKLKVFIWNDPLNVVQISEDKENWYSAKETNIFNYTTTPGTEGPVPLPRQNLEGWIINPIPVETNIQTLENGDNYNSFAKIIYIRLNPKMYNIVDKSHNPAFVGIIYQLDEEQNASN